MSDNHGWAPNVVLERSLRQWVVKLTTSKYKIGTVVKGSFISDILRSCFVLFASRYNYRVFFYSMRTIIR